MTQGCDDFNFIQSLFRFKTWLLVMNMPTVEYMGYSLQCQIQFDDPVSSLILGLCITIRTKWGLHVSSKSTPSQRL